MNTKKTNIYDYNNFRKYLADYQVMRQESEPGFTKSSISKLLGLPNTRSYFTDVLKGEKVSSLFAERFVHVLNLTKEEAQFFRVLVMLNQAETPEERELYFDQLISLNRTPKRIMEKCYYSYYKNWYNSVIRAMLHVFDFKNDYVGLSKAVFPSITVKQAKEAIALLQKLNLISKNENGYYKPTEQSIATPDGVRDELIKNYQLSCIEMAKNALLINSFIPQSISTNVISISNEGYGRIEKKIKKFRSEIRSLVHKDDKPAERVYQMDILLFPNSR
jgi:uncharacterized protein (TIGR02147 family)